MCARRVLVALFAVVDCGLGVLLGRLVLARFVVVGRLEMMMSSGRVVGGGLVVMLGRGMFRCRGHRSFSFEAGVGERRRRPNIGGSELVRVLAQQDRNSRADEQ